MKILFIFLLAGSMCIGIACSSNSGPRIEEAIEAESNALAPPTEEAPMYMIDDTSFILNDTMKVAPVDTIVYPK